MWCLIGNMAESQWDLCDLNNISKLLLLKLHSHISVLWHRIGYKAQNENPKITKKFYFWIFKVQMHVDLFFVHYFNFLSIKIEKKKQTHVNKSRVVRISWKTKICHIISKVAELFWEQCHLNNISRILEITFSYFSILGFLMKFHGFQVFIFWYWAQNQNPDITENLCL